MKMVWSYVKPFIPRMCLGLAIKFVATVMELLLPWMLSHIIDDVVPLGSYRLIFVWGAGMIIAAGLAWASNIGANRNAAWVSQHTTQAIRHDLFVKISELSCAQVDRFTIPTLESRLTSDTYHVHQMVGMIQRMGVRAPIMLIGGILITLTLDPMLTLVMVATLPFLAVVVTYVSKKGIPIYTLVQQKTDNMVRVVRENISGIRVIKALSKVDYERERFEGVNQAMVDQEIYAGKVMSLTNPITNVFLNLGITAVIFVGAFRVNAGLTQPGVILAFLSYFTLILNAMMGVTRIFMMVSRGAASGARIDEVLQTPVDLAVIPGEAEETENHVEFKDVTFSYNKKENNVEDINFSLKPGETLGIIGATGSGKSTLSALLMRLYDADSGSVKIGGKAVSAIDPADLHTKFGIVFQNDALFADTIYENIDFGRNLPREDIEKAVKAAQAWDFITALPDGFEHMLSAKGTNLSGGQRQRVLLARALAGSPEILILDDSSSALDYKTDAALRKALREEYSGTTTVIIAQRVSSIMHAAHILVIDDGREIGYGTHDELMKTCDVYREIAEIQMEQGAM